jgi:hypothetical protein
MSARQSVGKYDLEADTGAEAASAIAHRIITWTRS